MATTNYRLADDVYFCLAGSRIVFLDLPANKYLSLNTEHSQLALRLLSDSHSHDTNMSTDRQGDDDNDLLIVAQALLNRGLLARDHPGKRRSQPTVPTPTETFISASYATKVTIGFTRWNAFLVASAVASAKLHCWSMLRTIGSIRSRKSRTANRVVGNMNKLDTLLTAFNGLRPFYPRPYLCLYDSLALLEFLARHDYFPLWVFGVKSEPFGAHCWVQDMNYVLNDSVDHVSQYTPIMAV